MGEMERRMKEKICRFFYKYGMKRIAYRISPSLVCYWDMAKFHEGFKKGIGDAAERKEKSEKRRMKEYIMIKETGNAPITVAELIRCKDCKHRPKIDQEDAKNDTVDGFSFEFPDDFKCPCRCEDPYYNWMPKDDWYCGNGERKEE
jgi:hypothetical protein